MPCIFVGHGDIENITILKDVASTAIYGAEGANGVILITTVRAKFNQSQWNLKTAIGFSNITKSLPMMSPEDYMSSMMMEFYMRNQYRRDEVDFYQEYAEQIWNTAPHRFKNYEDEVMKTSIRNTYDLSFNGGSDILKNATFLSYMSSYAVFGLSWLIANNELIFIVVQYLGAFYLILIGIKSFRSFQDFHACM